MNKGLRHKGLYFESFVCGTYVRKNDLINKGLRPHSVCGCLNLYPGEKE